MRSISASLIVRIIPRREALTSTPYAFAGSVLTASFWNTQVRDNFIELDDFAGAWKSWTPAARTGINTALVTETAKYIQVGKTVWFRYFIQLTGAAITGGVSVRLPVSNASGNSYPVSVILADDGVGEYVGTGFLFGNDAYARAVRTDSTYAGFNELSSTIPFTWAANDRLHIAGCYEAS